MENAPNIAIEAFAIKFLYTDSRSAYAAFLNVVNGSRLKDFAKAVVERFNPWKTNKSGVTLFWLEQRQSMSTKKRQSVATKGLVDATTNEIPRAIQASCLLLQKRERLVLSSLLIVRVACAIRMKLV